MKFRTLAAIVLLIGSVGCGGSGGNGVSANDQSNSSNAAVTSAVNAGTGLVFAVSELYSNDPQGIVDVTLAGPGETSIFKLLHNGRASQPDRHHSGTVIVTEPCFSGSIEYRLISVLTTTGETSPITPCSSDIPTPNNFSWLVEGKLSPGGHRLAAHLHSPSEPPIAVVYEGSQEIARYPGYLFPTWIDDDTLVLVGSKLLTARLGENPTVLTNEVEGLSLGRVAVSPDASRMVFEWDSGLWLINTDGSGLRQLLPANRYVHPAWSPDGKWVATIQREAPNALDALLVGSGVVGTDFVYSNYQTMTLVNADSGDQVFTDVSMNMNDSQMPQGGLSWY